MDLSHSSTEHHPKKSHGVKIFALFAILASGFLLVVLTLGLRTMTKAIPSFGGVDFFFYICTSRDQLLSGAPMAVSNYFYFPGVYVAWSTLMRAVDFDLRSLQVAYLLAIAANMVLCGALVFVVTRAIWCGLSASTLYLFTAAYTEGAEGCTEVFCTLFFLSGLLIWTVMSKGGKESRAMIALGIFGAASLFMKQQAGLLLVGGLALLPLTLRKDGEIQIKIMHLIFAGVIFIFALSAFFGLEGGGFSALRFGLQGIGRYDDQQSFYENIRNLKPFMPLWGFVCVGAILWMASLFQIKSLNPQKVVFFTILGICLIGGAASMYQFKTRGYLHYAQLTAPSMAIVCSLSLFLSLQHLTHSPNFFGKALGSVLMIMCWGPLLLDWQKTAPLRDSITSLKNRTTADQIMAPFSKLCEVIPPHTELFLFPPRRNIIHWYCGTKSSIWVGGYGWGDVGIDEYKRTFANKELTHVFVLQKDSIDYNQPLVISLRGSPILAELEAEGFKPTLYMDSGTLFTR